MKAALVLWAVLLALAGSAAAGRLPRGYCAWTPSVISWVDWDYSFDPLRPEVKPPLSANCNGDLEANEQAWCKACAAAKSAVDCRRTTAYDYGGADQDSCTWVEDDKKGRVYRQVAFNLRVNYYNVRALMLKKTTCNVRVTIEKILGQGNRDPISQGYNAAVFDAGGYSPKCGPTYCDQTFTNNGVALRGYDYRGTFDYKPTNLTDYMLLSATVWTGYKKNLDAMASYDESCLFAPTQPQCKALQALGPYRYIAHITEEPCSKRYGPQMPPYNKVIKSNVAPWAQWGKGINVAEFLGTQITRFNVQQLTEYQAAKWVVTSERQKLVVGIVNSTFAEGICTAFGQTCDFYTALKKNALPRSFCYGTHCQGMWQAPTGNTPYSIVVAFAKFKLVDYVDENETLPSIVRYSLYGQTRPGVVVAKAP